MIKSAILFNLSDPVDLPALDGKLKENECRQPGSHELLTEGFSPLVDGSSFAVDLGAGFTALIYQRTERLLPANVVNAELESRIDDIEMEQLRKVGRKERAEIKENIIFEFLPRAFTVSSRNWVVIDSVQNRLIVGANSMKRAEDIVNCMRKAMGTLPAKLLSVDFSIASKLTHWANTSPPEGVLFGDRCDLKEPLEGGVIAKFSNAEISDESVDYHIKSNWQITRAKLQWRDDASFVLTEDLEFKGIKLLDSIAEQIDDQVSKTALQEISATLLIQCQSMFRDFLNVVIREGSVNE